MGFWPSPSPQQYLDDGLPLCLPRQSAAHDTQSSPMLGSQTPLPQNPAGSEKQSPPQVEQVSSCSHRPSLSHTGHCEQVVRSSEQNDVHRGVPERH